MLTNTHSEVLTEEKKQCALPQDMREKSREIFAILRLLKKGASLEAIGKLLQQTGYKPEALVGTLIALAEEIELDARKINQRR